MEELGDLLVETLTATELVQPVEMSILPDRIEVICRQLEGKGNGILTLIDNILAYSETSNLPVHICRRYIRKEGKTLFCWHFQVSGDDLAKNIQEFIDSILVSKQSKPAPKPSRPLAPGQHPVRTPPPRAPNPGSPQEVPEGFEFKLKTIKRERDSKGRITEIQEIPLPHSYKEMNVPKKEGGKGARGYSGE